MLATFAALLSLATAPVQGAPAAQNTGSALVSKMLKFYSGAQTMTGTIVYTATDADGQAKVTVTTSLQYDMPGKLFLRQVKSGGQDSSKTWLVTSDGKIFSYNLPNHLLETQDQRLVERVKQPDGDYDVRKIYAVAGAGSIGDRSVPLDIAIGRSEDLKHDVLSWITVVDKGVGKYRGEEVHSISGEWRPYGDASRQGNYELLITSEGKLMKYSIDRIIRFEGRDFSFTESWDVDLQMNGKTDPNLYRVVK